VLLAVLTSACSRPTSLKLHIELADGMPEPARLRVTEFGAGLLGEPKLRAMGSKTLPADLDLLPLDPTQPNFRFLLAGLDASGGITSQAAARASLKAADETRLEVTLGAPLGDCDSDGVPNLIDDCPSKYDPAQDCTTPAGPPMALACPPGAFFCQDFEGALDAGWQIDRHGSDQLAVDCVNPHGGAGQSLHLTATAEAGSHVLALQHGFGPSQTVALRASYYIQSNLGPSGFLTQLYSVPIQNAQIGFSIGSSSGDQTVFGLTQDLPGAADPSPEATTTTAIPLGAWFCLEMVLWRNAATTEVQVLVKPDGGSESVILDTLLDQSFQGVALTDFYVGFPRVPSGVANQIFVDDVVLAPERAECP
jgi:hypothetical protein